MTDVLELAYGSDQADLFGKTPTDLNSDSLPWHFNKIKFAGNFSTLSLYLGSKILLLLRQSVYNRALLTDHLSSLNILVDRRFKFYLLDNLPKTSEGKVLLPLYFYFLEVLVNENPVAIDNRLRNLLFTHHHNHRSHTYQIFIFLAQIFAYLFRCFSIEDREGVGLADYR